MSKQKKEEEKKPPAQFVDKILFESRHVMIFGEINMDIAQVISSQLIALDQINHDPIKVIVNSPGGHVEAGDTIYDTMKYIESPVITIGTGWVASIAAAIFLGAEKKNRFCLPNTRFLLHQPSGGMQGQVSDLEIQAKEILKTKARLNHLISKETGTALDIIEKHTERDYWLTADEAIKYGIVHKIVKTGKEIG